jgi:hypothetical protein
MSEKISKTVRILQICAECQEVIFNDTITLDVPKDYKVSDIRNQITKPSVNCADCTNIVAPSFSFIHQERIN